MYIVASLIWLWWVEARKPGNGDVMGACIIMLLHAPNLK